MEKTKDKVYLIFNISLVCALLFGIIIISVLYTTEQTTLDKVRFSYGIDQKIVEIEKQDEQRAEEYYDLAGESYIDQDYKRVISNCEKARDHYSRSGQAYRELKSEIEEQTRNELKDLYIDLIEEKVIIEMNMFEACEYFEGASKYYDIYYRVNTPYDDQSYAMGGYEIERMNEKIGSHDLAIERHNVILSKITNEIGNILEK